MPKVARLRFRSSPTGYLVQLDVPGRQDPFEGEIPVKADNIDEILSDLDEYITLLTGLSQNREIGEPFDECVAGEGLSSDCFQKIGQDLYRVFFPEDFEDPIAQLAMPLVFDVQPEDQKIPWELLHNGSEFLAQKLIMTRRPCIGSALDPFMPIKKSKEELKILLISADPYGDLRHVHQEVGELVEWLCAQGIEAPCLADVNCTFSRVTRALRDPSNDVIHFAGHVRFDSQNLANCGLILQDGALLNIQQIEHFLRGTPFVFINGCHSARGTVSQRCVWDPPRERVASLAAAFLRRGAWGFMGSQWPVADEVSHHFALTFYETLLCGASVGEALLMARVKSRDLDPPGYTWPSFLYYGEPENRLLQSEATFSGSLGERESPVLEESPNPEIQKQEDPSTTDPVDRVHLPSWPYIVAGITVLACLVFMAWIVFTLWPRTPRLALIAPQQFYVSDTSELAIAGEALTMKSEVFLNREGAAPILAENLRSEGKKLVTNLNLRNAEVGEWYVIARNPGGKEVAWPTPVYINSRPVGPLEQVEWRFLDEKLILTLWGEGLQAGLHVALFNNVLGHLNAQQVKTISDSQSEAIFNLPRLDPGEWDVIVTCLDNQKTIMNSAIVIPTPLPNPVPSQTPTLTATATPSPRPTVSPSSIAGSPQVAVPPSTFTPSPTPSITRSPTPSVTPSPTWTPTPPYPFSAAILSTPGGGATISGWSVTLAWRSEKELGLNQFYNVLLGPAPSQLASLGWTDKESYEIGRAQLPSGTYYWQVVRVELLDVRADGTKLWKQISAESEYWMFTWHAVNGLNQTSTPTPKVPPPDPW